METNEWYYIAVPKFIGHCFTDEVEGVFFDEDGNIFFNTNSTVDLQVLTSIFVTNLVHNVEKEVDSSISQNRYNTISANIDATNGDLVSPGEYGHSFRLVGDALNYAKSLGDYDVVLDFKANYPYPIVANNANVTFNVSDASSVVELNGLMMRFCNVAIQTPGRFILNPTNIEPFIYNSVIYGGYAQNCDFNISLGTWHALNSPNAYDSTHMRIYFNNSNVKIQDVSYCRFYNCLVTHGSNAISSTTIYERSVFLTHTS